jgi:hypothetical protein
MSFTGSNASGWSCKLREHSSAAICTLWFPPTWAKRIPERFCCRFVGRMRNSLLWKCIVHSSSNDQTAILSSMIWLDHHSFLLSFLLAFFLFFFLSFFLSFLLSCMHLLIKQKKKFGLLFYTFPLLESEQESLR